MCNYSNSSSCNSSTAQHSNNTSKNNDDIRDEKKKKEKSNSVVPPPEVLQQLPIVDLSQPLEQIARAVDEACREIGFFYIVNHGVDAEIIRRTQSLSRELFDLPLPQKEEYSMTKSSSGIRGYFRVGEEDLNAKDSTRELEEDDNYFGDYKEGFDCGRDGVNQEPDFGTHPLIDVNQWPSEEFQKGMLEYQEKLLRVMQILLKSFAMGLGLPQDYFEPLTTRPMLTLRLLHYPPIEMENDDSTMMGAGAHTDYGLCTVLHQDDVGGLEVLRKDGHWMSVPPIPNSFVINIGDMMSRWTNGAYASTLHRVILHSSSGDRYSMPFFFNPNVGTPIESLVKDEEAKFAPTTSDELLLQRYEQSFTHVTK